MSGGSSIRTINTTYNTIGQVESVSDPDSTYTYTYDSIGRLSSTDNGGQLTSGQTGTPNIPRVVLTNGYDKNGNRTGLAASIGTALDFKNVYAYDDLNRNTSV